MDDEAVGVKRRNQRLREESTVTSEELTPLTDFEFDWALGSIKLKRRRLTVPLMLQRREASRKAEKRKREKRTFHGRRGLKVSDDAVGAMLWIHSELRLVIICTKLKDNRPLSLKGIRRMKIVLNIFSKVTQESNKNSLSDRIW